MHGLLSHGPCLPGGTAANPVSAQTPAPTMCCTAANRRYGEPHWRLAHLVNSGTTLAHWKMRLHAAATVSAARPIGPAAGLTLIRLPRMRRPPLPAQQKLPPGVRTGPARVSGPAAQTPSRAAPV